MDVQMSNSPSRSYPDSTFPQPPVLIDLDAPTSFSNCNEYEQRNHLTGMDSSQKVHQWYMQHHQQFNDSGIQSMENSKAPSIVSVNMVGRTQHTSIDGNDASDQFVAPIQSYLPTETQNAKRVLPELIPLLRDPDAEVACRALEMVIHISKLQGDPKLQDTAQSYYEPIIDDRQLIEALISEMHASFDNKRILRLTLCALFHISNQPLGMQLILDTASLTTSPQSPTENGLKPLNNLNFIAMLLECISVPNESCYKYALLILHNILCGKNAPSKRVVDFVRDERALGSIVEWLAVEKNEKLLSIIVDIIQIVCDRNGEQKAFFIALNGPAMLCGILSWARYENLLWRNTRLLKSVSNYDPQKIVDSGAYEVFPINMDHASQRLVVELLRCTRDLSDMSTTKLDISHLLGRLVQLLGSNDIEVRQLVVQSLANLSANNRRNKEFLCGMDILKFLKHLLYETESMLEEQNLTPPKFVEMLEDIQENALTALRNLFSGHAFELEIQQQILHQNGADFFLRKLQQMRPALVRKVLLILSKAATHDSNIPIFRHSCFQSGPDLDTNFAERLVYTLYVSACKLKQTKTIEQIKLNELMHLSMLTMQKLSRDGVLARQIIHYLKEYQIAPSTNSQSFTLLPVFAMLTKDDLLVHSSIGLLAELVNFPEICAVLSSNSAAISVLENMRRNISGSTALLAQKILKCVGSIQPIISSGHYYVGTPHRTTRENSPCPTMSIGLMEAQTDSLNESYYPRSYSINHQPNDSAYYSMHESSEHNIYSIMSPIDDYYNRMAEGYQSMHITSTTGSDYTSNLQHRITPNPHSQIYSTPPVQSIMPTSFNDEHNEFYCDGSDNRAEFYM